VSGPSVKLPADWLDSDRIEDVDADTLMLMLTALAHSARQTSNGVVPRRQLRTLWAVDDVDEAVAQLVQAGEVEDQGDRLLFVNWRDFILDADEVESIRAASRERSNRSRRHRQGDHSMCRPDYCQAAARNARGDGTRDVSGDATVRGSDADPIRSAPTRSDPTAREGRSGKGRAPAARSAGAAQAASAAPWETSGIPAGIAPTVAIVRE
jgi:hypothetical protein